MDQCFWNKLYYKGICHINVLSRYYLVKMYSFHCVGVPKYSRRFLSCTLSTGIYSTYHTLLWYGMNLAFSLLLHEFLGRWGEITTMHIEPLGLSLWAESAWNTIHQQKHTRETSVFNITFLKKNSEDLEMLSGMEANCTHCITPQIREFSAWLWPDF